MERPRRLSQGDRRRRGHRKAEGGTPHRGLLHAVMLSGLYYDTYIYTTSKAAHIPDLLSWLNLLIEGAVYYVLLIASVCTRQTFSPVTRYYEYCNVLVRPTLITRILRSCFLNNNQTATAQSSFFNHLKYFLDRLVELNLVLYVVVYHTIYRCPRNIHHDNQKNLGPILAIVRFFFQLSVWKAL